MPDRIDCDAGVGQLLWLSGHLSVRRGDRESGRQLIQNSRELIRRGVSVLYFPEATRKISTTARLGDFKPGAFKTAIEEKCPVVPITVSGARKLMPPYGFPEFSPGHVVVTIHPPLQPSSSEPPSEAADLRAAVERLSEQARKAIDGGLRCCDDFTHDADTCEVCNGHVKTE